MQPAAWSRKSWVGSVPATIDPTGSSFVHLYGVTEHAGLATNLDIIVDFTQVKRPTGVTVAVLVATYVVSHVGQKIYQGQWLFGLPSYASGIAPPPSTLVKFPFPVPTTLGGTQVLSGYTGIMQNGGVAGMLWGIEIGVTQSTATPAQQELRNLFVGSIAHGREI